MATTSRLELRGDVPRAFDDVLTPEALEFIGALQREFGGRRSDLLDARRQRRERLLEGGTLDFLPGTEEIRAGDWTVAPVPADLRQRWVEITGPTDRKMVINALNSGRRRLHGRLRGRQLPHLAQHGQRAARTCATRSTGTITYDGSDGRHYELGERPGDAAGPPARLAPARAPPAASTASRSSGSLFDFGLYFFHCAAAWPRAGHGAVLLPAQAGVPSGGATVERRVRLQPRRRVGLDARDDQGHGADRDAARRRFEMDEILYELRDHSAGPERRPLGLHLLARSSASRDRPGDGAARPRRRDDDGAVHAGLHRAAGRHLPPPRRARDGRHGRADPVAHATRRPTRRRSPAVRADKEREVGAGLRRHLGRPSRPGRRPRARCSSRAGGAPNQLGRSARRRARDADDAARPRRDAGRDHRGRPAHQRQRRLPVRLVLARRPRRGGDQLADGGRRHRRDLPLARSGSGSTTGPSSRTGARVTAELVRQVLDEETARIRDEVGEETWAGGPPRRDPGDLRASVRCPSR